MTYAVRNIRNQKRTESPVHGTIGSPRCAAQTKRSLRSNIAKDPQIKRFKAKIKQINGALARIAFLEEQTQTPGKRRNSVSLKKQPQRAASIAGEIKKEKKKAEEKALNPRRRAEARPLPKANRKHPKEGQVTSSCPLRAQAGPGTKKNETPVCGAVFVVRCPSRTDMIGTVGPCTLAYSAAS